MLKTTIVEKLEEHSLNVYKRMLKTTIVDIGRTFTVQEFQKCAKCKIMCNIMSQIVQAECMCTLTLHS